VNGTTTAFLGFDSAAQCATGRV